MKCEYGCEQEAKYQMSSGKWCCEKVYTKCLSIRKKCSDSKKGKPSHWKGKKRGPESEETKKKKSISNKGQNKGKKIEQIMGIEKARKVRENMVERMVNGKAKLMNLIPRDETKIKINNEKSRIRMLNGQANFMNTIPRDPIKILSASEKSRQRLLNGQALKMIKAIKKISNEEIKLRNMVKELYPDCEFQHSVFRYSLDVALVKEKIAIEYDGYYHFDTEEHKEYHKERQEKIENEGWRFYRVTMFDKFPRIEEVKENIENLIKGN